MTTTALILAAGKGTRMRSSLSKVLHPLCGRPMAGWAVAAARGAGCEVAAVIGHQADRVRAALGDGLAYALQEDPQGTGHAVLCADGAVPRSGVLVVMPGDAPLIRAETLQALIDGHAGLCTVLTAMVDPEDVPASAYGRIVRGPDGAVQRIVEAANATPEERMIREFNTGIYAFDADWLFNEVLPNLRPHPPKGEYYLTDAIEAAADAGALSAVRHGDRSEVMGVNDRAALSVAEAALRARINQAWMLAGVTLRDPATTYIDADVALARDVTLDPGVVLRGATTIGEGASVGAHSVLTDTSVAAGATVHPGSICEGAVVGPRASVGPMARLRTGAVLEDSVKVGNFVEVKKTVLRAGAKASHLSYLGDAEIGADANIGAGTITCNYDGFAKHRTVIGPGAFIGSNSALVAPITIGAGALVGAGAAVSEDVPDDALALTRTPQKNLDKMGAVLRERYRARAEGRKRAAAKPPTPEEDPA